MIPQSVSPAPTIKAVKILGSRISQIIDCVLSSHVTGNTSFPAILFTRNPRIVSKSIATLPSLTARIMEISSTIAITTRKTAYLVFVSNGNNFLLLTLISSPNECSVPFLYSKKISKICKQKKTPSLSFLRLPPVMETQGRHLYPISYAG